MKPRTNVTQIWSWFHPALNIYSTKVRIQCEYIDFRPTNNVSTSDINQITHSIHHSIFPTQKYSVSQSNSQLIVTSRDIPPAILSLGSQSTSSTGVCSESLL